MTKKQKMERRQPAKDIVKHMISERQQLLALALQVSNIDTKNTDNIDRDLLEELCQLLVDYIASGHFGLYERIIDGRERRQIVAELATKIYPRIEETTEIVLAFSEKYDSDHGIIDLSKLQENLSFLIEKLTLRIELEDQLINAM